MYPHFVDKSAGDYHLSYFSPCIDRGTFGFYTPAEDMEGDARDDGVVDIGADEFRAHLYVNGDCSPGGLISVNIVGEPETSPVALLVGSGVLADPLSTWLGDLWLEAPLTLVAPLDPIPLDGVLVLAAIIPPMPQAPYDVAMQALIGINPDSLSNLEVLKIR